MIHRHARYTLNEYNNKNLIDKLLKLFVSYTISRLKSLNSVLCIL